jgi:hypothetical protein
MNDPDREIPPTELEQPDPQLSLSSGRASALQITLATLGAVFILALMIYGLNRPMNEPGQSAAAPPAQETTGAAPQNPQAQPNTPAQQPKAGSQQNEPAQQPQPEPVKPGQPDDSQR